MYEGEYDNDLKNGFGIFKWESGNKYIGHYTNDERDGIGKMIWTDGSYYIGEWKKGIQHGYGRMYFPDGTVKEGLFDKNVFKGKEGLDSYDIPKELLDPNFNIMEHAGKDMKFSDEILGIGKPPLKGDRTIYTTSISRKKSALNKSLDSKNNLTAKARNGKFIISSGKMSEENSRMESVAESPYRIRIKRKKIRRVRKRSPKGVWIPAGRLNNVSINRAPGGI